jgi:hypothetical protein
MIKKQTLSLVLACAGALVFAGCTSTSTQELAPKSAATANNWDKIIVTRNADDVEGMTPVGDVSASAHIFFGGPASLRKSATIKLKKQAVKMGATAVLMTMDVFEAALINNVSMTGVAYK